MSSLPSPTPATRSTMGSARARALSLDEGATALFGHCMNAFQAFQGLNQLAEDMRILSLNAELAAGRAGTAGVAVRALTQYTRQLVSQLNRLEQEMSALKVSTNDLSTQTAKDLEALRQIRENSTIDYTDSDQRSEGEVLANVTPLLSQMMDNARKLGSHAGRIRQVADQSNGIATNIAIEAAAAGRHESEFRTVSDTMKRYIELLQSMVERANHAIRQADEMGQALTRRLASTNALS